MVKELIHDPLFLGIKSKPATKEDILVGRDLIDTLMAHRKPASAWRRAVALSQSRTQVSALGALLHGSC